jgi:hypothetical protein
MSGLAILTAWTVGATIAACAVASLFGAPATFYVGLIATVAVGYVLNLLLMLLVLRRD